MTVLLVDDDPAILGVMKMRLEQRGYRIATANSALAAERVAIKEQPEFALVDVIMPGINGVELCRRLTHNPDLSPQLRVVMLSSVNDPPIIEAATKAGAIGYIVKSSDLNATLAAVLRLLEASADDAAGTSNSL